MTSAHIFVHIQPGRIPGVPDLQQGIGYSPCYHFELPPRYVVLPRSTYSPVRFILLAAFYILQYLDLHSRASRCAENSAFCWSGGRVHDSQEKVRKSIVIEVADTQGN